MAEQQNDLQIAWWAKIIDELDHEIGRLCAICQVRILDPGIIERALKKDASVCGTANRIAFAKLHNMLMLYFAIREKGRSMPSGSWNRRRSRRMSSRS